MISNSRNYLLQEMCIRDSRNYDNALIELRNELENNHFHTIAAGAFVAQHAFTDQLATMRPDKSDQEEIRGFAKRIVMIVEMIQTLGEIPKPCLLYTSGETSASE